jgi:methylmalonyl-CoA/ethylmalonyl-CoA epimerase
VSSVTDFETLTRSLDQIGLVVSDLEPIKQGMLTLFDLGPRSEIEVVFRRSIYRGTEVDVELGVLFYELWGIELEFLCPHGGENLWQEFLDSHGGGLHHVRFQVEDQHGAVDYFADRGVDVLQMGDSSRGNGIKFIYYDTVPLVGFIVETFNASQPSAPTPPTTDTCPSFPERNPDD